MAVKEESQERRAVRDMIPLLRASFPNLANAVSCPFLFCGISGAGRGGLELFGFGCIVGLGFLRSEC